MGILGLVVFWSQCYGYSRASASGVLELVLRLG